MPLVVNLTKSAEGTALTISSDKSATFAGTINSGAITSTAGITGTTGTFSGDVNVSRLKVNSKFAFEDVSNVLWVGEYFGSILHKQDTTFAGTITTTGNFTNNGAYTTTFVNTGSNANMNITAGNGSARLYLDGTEWGELWFET